MQYQTKHSRASRRAVLRTCLAFAAFAAVLLPFANAAGQPEYNPKELLLPDVCKVNGTAPSQLGKDIVNCTIRGLATPTTPTQLKFTLTQPPDFDILITARFRTGEGSLSFIVPQSDELSSDPSWQSFVSGPKDLATLLIQRTVFQEIFKAYNGQFTEFGFQITATSLSANFIATVFTPTNQKRLAAKDEKVLLELFTRCCPKGFEDNALCTKLAAATNATRSVKDDICNDPPNMCTEENRLMRFIMFPLEGDDGLKCPDAKLPLDLISQLTALDYLDFDGNNLAADMADVTEALGKLPNLETVYLSDNSITGKLDCSLIKAPMQRLWLENNKITGTVPPCFLASQDLTTLSLSGNRLTGTLPRIKAPIALVNLFLNTQQQGYGFEALPPNLEEATSLQSFYARGHGIGGPLPKLPENIAEVDLNRNQFEGTIPKAYSQLINLQTLTLARNKLIGDIPSDLIKAPSLSLLDLSHNKLTGGLTKLPWDKVSGSLAWVSLTNNSLTGPLPAFPITDTNYFRLTSLFLSDNQLTGTLDDFASTIEPLDTKTNPGGAPIYGNYYLRLALANNQFTGAIPNRLANMLMWDMTDTTRAVNLLDLSGNQLSGRFPLWIYNKLAALVAGGELEVLVDLDGNKLECPGKGDVTSAVQVVQNIFQFSCYLSAENATVPVDQALSESYQLPAEAGGSTINTGTSTSLPRSFGPADTTSSASSAASSAGSSDKKGSALSTSALIGICVGAVVGGAILIVLAIVLAYKLSRKKGSKRYTDFDKGPDMQMQPVAAAGAPATVLPPQASHASSTV